MKTPIKLVCHLLYDRGCFVFFIEEEDDTIYIMYINQYSFSAIILLLSLFIFF